MFWEKEIYNWQNDISKHFHVTTAFHAFVLVEIVLEKRIALGKEYHFLQNSFKIVDRQSFKYIAIKTKKATKFSVKVLS